MSIESDRERLSQAKRLEWLQRGFQMTELIDVCFSSSKSENSDSASSIVIYCALIPIEKGYAILDELVGFCQSDRTDGSVNHDEAIYGLRSKP